MKSIGGALALVMVLAACGTADRGLEAPVSVAAAVAATTEAGTGRTHTVSVTNTADRTWTSRSVGVHDYRSGRSEITYEFEGRRSRTIIIGEASYGELDASDAFRSAPGKRWIRNDPLTEERFEELNRDSCDDEDAGEESGDAADEDKASAAEEGVGGQEVEGFGSCSTLLLVADSPAEREDPGKTLDFLGEYGSALSVVGREDVRGVPTMHVRTHVDFRRASEVSYLEQGWSRENIERVLESEPRKPGLVDVWVDGEGLVRRVRTARTYELPADERFPELPDGWGSSTSVTTTEYFDFGVEVDIQAPPESEVIDGDEWLRTATEHADSLPIPSEAP